MLLQKGQWRRAERAFYNGIRLAPQSPEGKSSNIEATCYYYLSLCSEAKNRLEQTIRMADNGIEAFIPDEGRQQVYYDLIYRKALSLRKLGRLGEATKEIEQIWDHIDQMENTSTVIGLYTLRSELASRSGIYADAIQYAEEGFGNCPRKPRFLPECLICGVCWDRSILHKKNGTRRNLA